MTRWKRRRRGRRRRQRRGRGGVRTHNPVLEGDKLLLLLLPALEVSVDQSLQLDQVLVLTLLLDVL